MRTLVSTVAVFIVGAAACAPSEDAQTGDHQAQVRTDARSTASDLDGTAWNLVTLDDIPAVSIDSDIDPRPDPGIEFVNGHGGGFSGCNAYGGPYVHDGGIMRFGFVFANQMGCGGEIGEQEEALFEMLHGGVRVVRRGDALTLSGNGHVAEFVAGTECISCGTIERVDRELVGTNWRIRRVDEHSAPGFWSDDSEVSYLRYGPDSLTMTLGCNVYRAGYVHSGRTIVTGSLASTEKECAGEPGLLEPRVAAILAADPRITFSHNHDAVVGGEEGVFVMEIWPLPQDKGAR